MECSSIFRKHPFLHTLLLLFFCIALAPVLQSRVLFTYFIASKKFSLLLLTYISSADQLRNNFRQQIYSFLQHSAQGWSVGYAFVFRCFCLIFCHDFKLLAYVRVSISDKITLSAILRMLFIHILATHGCIFSLLLDILKSLKLAADLGCFLLHYLQKPQLQFRLHSALPGISMYYSNQCI